MKAEWRSPPVLLALGLTLFVCLIDFFNRVVSLGPESKAAWSAPEYELSLAKNLTAEIPSTLNQWLEVAKEERTDKSQPAEQTEPEEVSPLLGGTNLGELSVRLRATFLSDSKSMILLEQRSKEKGDEFNLWFEGDSVKNYKVTSISKGEAVLTPVGNEGSGAITLQVFERATNSMPVEPPVSDTGQQNRTEPPQESSAGPDEETERAVLTEEERKEFEALLNAPKHSGGKDLKEGNNNG